MTHEQGGEQAPAPVASEAVARTSRELPKELIHPEPAERFLVGYVVLAVSFVLEGISFLQSAPSVGPTRCA